jgi:N-acetyl-gamma-glutamyl-phosphate reductase
VPVFIANEAALACEADVTFVCLGHEEAAAAVPSKRGVVVDLSGAHRLRDAALYDEWYGFSHPHPRELEDWVYGLPELVDVTGRLVANPGCYATAALLALGPVREAIDPDGVVVDAKSGMTGAGRVPKASTHAGFVLENVSPYKVGAHQHVAEMAQLLGFPVSFAPHLLPIRRGLIATCYVQSTGPDLRSLLEAHYASSQVVTVLPEGTTPEIARVQGTDAAEIGVFADRFTGRTIVVCAIDNLGKGAAGQAVQNVNRLFGFKDTDGLLLSGVRV